jgi:RNA-dependent RNA polymerase
MSHGSRVSSEVIINLAENGVPWNVFEKLMQNAYDEKVRAWTDFEGPDAIVRLSNYISTSSGILRMRQARSCATEARALGLRFDNKNVEADGSYDADDQSADEDDGLQQSTAWFPDPVSGLPSTLEETALEALHHGWTPQKSRVMRSKLLECAKNDIKRSHKPPRFQITIPRSAFAMFIPGETVGSFADASITYCLTEDPFGVLEEGEVFVKSSKLMNLCENGHSWESDVLRGPVLVCPPYYAIPHSILTHMGRLRDTHVRYQVMCKGLDIRYIEIAISY